MMAFGGQMFDAHMMPPTVPPRKEKRPKVKQDLKVKPYTESTPLPLSPAHPDDKLTLELQRLNPYTEKTSKSSRPSAQDKLQLERLRILAGAGTASGQNQPNGTNASASRASLPPSYHSTSPSSTFTALPPYSPGHYGSQQQVQESGRRKRLSLFRRLSRSSSGGGISEDIPSALPTIAQNVAEGDVRAGGERE